MVVELRLLVTIASQTRPPASYLSSSMAIEVSTVFPVAILMRKIGPLALSHTRFVTLLH